MLQNRIFDFCRGGGGGWGGGDYRLFDSCANHISDSYIEPSNLCWIYSIGAVNFHYNHMKVKYSHANLLQLLFTDTDSLAYAVQADGTYEYPIDHPLYSASNCKAVAYFKDELNSVPMEEFVVLRPKC